VKDLFAGFTIGDPSADLPGDAIKDHLDNDAAEQSVSRALAEAYAAAAEKIAANVTGDLPRLMGCPGDCFASFLAGFGARVYRRPLTAAETARLTALHDRVAPTLGVRLAVQAVLERMLQSPQFLYRVEATSPEAAGPTGRARLSSYELASRLSYLLWGTMPDADLLAAAKRGALEDRAELLRQAQRLFASPRARPGLGHLFDEWLGLDEVAKLDKYRKHFPP
jgi:hypothetical protein